MTLVRLNEQVGDQIIRMNGHPVEDAVHREIALLAKHRQDLVLKIRSKLMYLVLDILQRYALEGERPSFSVGPLMTG